MGPGTFTVPPQPGPEQLPIARQVNDSLPTEAKSKPSVSSVCVESWKVCDIPVSQPMVTVGQLIEQSVAGVDKLAPGMKEISLVSKLKLTVSVIISAFPGAMVSGKD